MSFMSFRGRIGRSMWWLTGALQLLLIAAAIGYVAAADAQDIRTGWQAPVFLLIVLICTWIGLCANIKRFHDRGKPGFWVLVGFVPVIGPVWLFIELGFMPGTDGDNMFGPPSGSGLAQLGSIAAPAVEDPASASGLAKLDDAYFRDYAANKMAAAKTPAGTAASGIARRGRGTRAAFGKRGLPASA